MIYIQTLSTALQFPFQIKNKNKIENYAHL
jgi:hypothetical protein